MSYSISKMQKRHFHESQPQIHDIRVGPQQILIQGVTMEGICAFIKTCEVAAFINCYKELFNERYNILSDSWHGNLSWLDCRSRPLWQ